MIALVLEPALGCQVQLVSGFDTDQLGSFTRDIPPPAVSWRRRGASQDRHGAVRPVDRAGEQRHLRARPLTGLFPWNVELLVLIDDLQGIEIVGMARGEAQSGHLLTGDWDEARAFAATEDFSGPPAGTATAASGRSAPAQGIADWDRLRSCFEDCKAQAGNGPCSGNRPARLCQPQSHEPHRRGRLRPAAAPAIALSGLRPARLLGDRAASRPALRACGEPTAIYRVEIWHCPSCTHPCRRARAPTGPASAQHRTASTATPDQLRAGVSCRLSTPSMPRSRRESSNREVVRGLEMAGDHHELPAQLPMLAGDMQRALAQRIAPLAHRGTGLRVRRPHGRPESQAVTPTASREGSRTSTWTPHIISDADSSASRMAAG